MKKRISVSLLALVLIVSILGSCSSGGTKEVTLTQLQDAVSAAVTNKADMSDFAIDTMQSFYSDINPELVKEYKAMRTTQGTSADQFGVFICKDEAAAKEFSSQLSSGIKTLAESAANFNYTPEEQPKLDNAKVETNGKYVMFAILSDTERAAAISAFNALFK